MVKIDTLRIVIIIIVVSVLAFELCGCCPVAENNNNLLQNNYNNTSPSAQNDVMLEPEFKANIIHVGGGLKDAWVADSRKDLDDYIQKYKDIWFLDTISERSGASFIQATEIYDEKFFEQYQLLLVTVRRSESGIRDVKVNKVAVGSACNVYVTYRITTHLESFCYQVII